MRLVCPNCDAEYEIEASVIPDAGRDVQCSNCGYAWFQGSPALAAAAAEEAELFGAPALVPETSANTAPAPDLRATPRGLDETVLAVLREEAEREAAARRTEAAGPIETQAELGLTQPQASAMPETPSEGAVSNVTPIARRLAKLKGIDPDPRPVPRPQTRREMLPAIEEINSTLRATSEKRTGEQVALSPGAAMPVSGGAGFRNGFVLTLLLALISLAAYVMAPRLVQQIPGAAPALEAYVAAVDAARLWIDGVLQQAISLLRGASDDGSA